jgi:acetoin utilization deacetylase AcuC-like enzyme
MTMKYVWSPDYEVDIGEHVFPTAKYRLIRDYLLEHNICQVEDFLVPVPATTEQLGAVHSAEYLSDLDNLHRSERTLYSELPLRQDIVDAYKLAAGGTILACRAAIASKPGVCCHIGGGFHHAFANHAEGFCYINDIAVGIRTMQAEGHIKKAAVIDCDLHQGNGTASIFLDDPDILTLSIHQEKNYPRKETSDIDIGLDDFADDIEYLAHLEEALPGVFAHDPDMVIYVAGADPYQEDVLGRLKLTMHGLADRDRMVLSNCVSRNIPVVTVTAGGYARHVADTVKIHAQTIMIATELYSQAKTIN